GEAARHHVRAAVRTDARQACHPGLGDPRTHERAVHARTLAPPDRRTTNQRVSGYPLGLRSCSRLSLVAPSLQCARTWGSMARLPASSMAERATRRLAALANA